MLSKIQNLSPLIEKLLSLNHIKTFTTVQESAIPSILNGQKIFLKAPTGTGKTYCYLLPIIDKLIKKPKSYLAIIILPTKELASQLYKTTSALLKTKTEESVPLFNKKYKLVLLNGSFTHKEEVHQLKKRPQVLITTPGRFLAHLKQTKINEEPLLQPDKIRPKFFIFDEADRLFGQSFREEIKETLSLFNFQDLESDDTKKNESYKKEKRKQTQTQFLFFSATCDEEIKSILCSLKFKLRYIDTCSSQKNNIKEEYQKELQASASGEASPLVRENMLFVPKESFLLTLCYLVCKQGSYQKTIVFVNSIAKSLYLYKFLTMLQEGSESAEIKPPVIESLKITNLNGSMNVKERAKALGSSWNVLVTTDVAERGIDVADVGLVINVEMPRTKEIYIHRKGRTGRMGKEGRSICLISENSVFNFLVIEEALKKERGRGIEGLEKNEGLEGLGDVERMEKEVGIDRDSCERLFKEAKKSQEI